MKTQKEIIGLTSNEAFKAGKSKAIKQVIDIESILLKECDSALKNAKELVLGHIKSKLGELAKEQSSGDKK